MRTKRLVVVVHLLVGLAVLGCGSDTGLDLAYVRGKVTFDGKPVPNGTVIFEPDASKNTTGPTAMGTINRDGEFVMSSSSGGDGAVVGFHKVAIIGLEAEPITAGDQAPPPSPEADSLGYLKGKAKAAQQSSKKARTAEKTGEETFTDRAGRTFRYVTPKRLSDPSESGIEVEVVRGSNRFDFDIREDGSVAVEK
jgi:hypothetical protein